MDLTTLNRYLAGECTDKERGKLEHWLEEDSLNRGYFNFLKKIWDTEINDPINFDSDKIFRKIQEQLSQEKTNNLELITSIAESHQLTYFSDVDRKGRIKQSWKGRLYSSQFYKVAAVLLVGLFGIGVIFYHLNQQADSNNDFLQINLTEVQSFETLRGKISTIDVRDGIQIRMNNSSSIKVFSNEEEDRVKLEGEAYFDIQRNEKKKFIVQTNSISISVIGTKFNVKSREDLQTIEIVVQEGGVVVDLFDEYINTESVFLSKGEQFIYNKKDKRFWIQDQVNLDDLLLWIDGGLYFDKTPLSEVLLRLEDKYAVDFIVSDSTLLKRSLTARFKNEELAEILEITALILGFEYRKVDENLFEL